MNEVPQGGSRAVVKEFNDPVARLQQAIDEGLVDLEFDDTHGYLPALLEALGMRVASQLLPVAKSSFQISQVSPQTPHPTA